MIGNDRTMTGQLSLPGLDPSQPPLDRLFFAIFPAVDAATCMMRLAQRQRDEHRLKCKPLDADRFHITLHHLGDYDGLPRGIVAAARDAAASVAMPPFGITFDRVVSFRGRPGNRPFVLCGSDGVAALMAFQQSLGMAMGKAGLGHKAEWHFTPHATLLYDDCLVTEQVVETIGWTVHEFVLVHSLLGRGLHVPLARWPLRG
jgi:2'-5' RNA ligase